MGNKAFGVLKVLLEEATTALTEHKKNVELQKLRVAKYEGRVIALEAAMAHLKGTPEG